MSQRVIDTSVLFAVAVLLMLTAQQSLKAQATAQSHLYFFTNDGCAPCRQVEPAIDTLHGEGYPVTVVNISQQPQVADQFQVDRTPTVVLVTGNRITGRHAGQIDYQTLREWFAAVGQQPNTQPAITQSRPKPKTSSPIGSKIVVADSGNRAVRAMPANFSSPTMHRGTTRPTNDAETRAMAATVRLKVEDPDGISYATGTIIHSRPGEALVLTCGHVFRDANGQGVITAEYGFDKGQIESVPGQLIDYDAKARDIGLVSIRTKGAVTSVVVAAEDSTVARGDQSFSIGCDHGEPPTIRHTAIKNRATYDGEIKYDIYGRPVDGRSGGGLFTERGELIGVCNAAAVEVDEGIYSGLDSIYWQFAQTNLSDLFIGQNQLATKTTPPNDHFASTKGTRQEFAKSLADQRSDLPRTRIRSRQQLAVGGRDSRAQMTTVGLQLEHPSQPDQSNSDMEVIILVRSKTDPRNIDTITVTDPSTELLDFLGQMSDSTNRERQLDVAQLRKRIVYPTNHNP